MTHSTQPVPRAADTPTPQQREQAVTIYERSVEGRRAATLERQGELHRAGVLQVGQRDADQRQPAALDRRHGGGQQTTSHGEDDVRPGRRLEQRVGARRA